MKKTIITLVAVVAMLALVSTSFAEFHALWKNKKLVKELKLSDKQIDKIKDMTIKTEKKMIQIRAETELAEIDLREIMDADNPDEDKAIAFVKQIMELQTEKRILRIKEMISMKKILSAEQLEKLEKIRTEHHMKKKGHKGKEGDRMPDKHHRKKMHP